MATQPETGTPEAEDVTRFEIYRGKDAENFDELDCMEMTGLTEIIQDGIVRAGEAGAGEGQLVKMLFSIPGMSLTYAWFKSGFPLPLHSHNADCLYYIVSGTLRLGTEDLGAGDGFFVGADVPYSYTPGPEGVEVLEFRTANKFDIRFLGKTRKFWDKTVASVERRRADWAKETSPPARISS
ncbi:cupin domain-containing protein [Novosphingobium sp. ZN18A2]|uniref:cupin domain-containing protein n=1 Tax=Novosphingobium sp. ZN18A2 TaxID=3079861 RepID=UPI0030D122DC